MFVINFKLNDLLLFEFVYFFNEFMNSKNFNICENLLIKKYVEIVLVWILIYILFDFNGLSIVIVFFCMCIKI